MNNSFLTIESLGLTEENPVDRTEKLKEREGELLRIIEALRAVQDTKGWNTLKELVFASISDTLHKEITDEAREDNPDTLRLSRLAGQLKWAERFSDLNKLEQVYRVELANIRRIYGKT